MGVESRTGNDKRASIVEPSVNSTPALILVSDINFPSHLSRREYKKNKRKERMNTARDFILSQDSSNPLVGDLQEGVEILIEPQHPSYVRELLQILGKNDFNKVGDSLSQRLNTGPATAEEIINSDKGLSQKMDQLVVERMIEGFVETGYVVHTKNGKLKLTTRGKETGALGYDAIKSSLIAFEALMPTNPPRKFTSVKEVERAHELREEDMVNEVSVVLDKPSARILYLSEILVGNYGSDITALRDVLKKIKKNPEELRPDIVVVSGIMEGTHDYRQKERRLGLQDGLEKQDAQFASAKIILDEIGRLGGKIVYIVSNNDREIARDGTLKTLKMLREQGDPLADKDSSLAYWQQDQLRQDKQYEKIYRFQLDIVFPYNLRSGRRLRSAREVSEITNGRLEMEEYLILHDAYHALLTNESIPDIYRKVLDMDSIVLPNQESDFTIHDGADLEISGKNLDFTIALRDGLTFSDTPAYQDPTATARAYLNQLNSNGIDHPKILSTMNQQDGFTIGRAEGDFLISTPGFTDSQRALDIKSTKAKAGLPIAWRTLHRRSLAKPAGVMYEHTSDKRLITTILDPVLIDKADKAERTAIVNITDWQTGSTTARPDLQVKFTDYWLSRVLPEMPVIIATDGDIIHGRNYPEMPNENAHIGLIAIEAQQKFVMDLLEQATDHVSAGDLYNISKIIIVPGNHEWNSGHERTGAIYNQYLESIFREMFLKKGIIPPAGLIKAYGATRTDYGDHFKAWSATEQDIAGYGFVFQHMLLEKGAKGGGSKPSVYQAAELFGGLGDLTKDVQFGVFGHWHHYMMRQFGNKVALVNPSLAGVSGYEWARGYRPQMGASIMYVGGGLPPQVELLTVPTLVQHEIENGFFSLKNLAKNGYKDDRHFDPLRHGFVDNKGAIQKALHGSISDIIGTPQSSIRR